ncbi:xanthotoxin 5-hydroxylase CYP82C4-like [Impatiens glandulifera]|uniref:xanthotoxin 5-hydroxylase CYP82C4-like n=1 Tax=Impatiens glandulifera TaxID=253017 RepID=UPI001FB12927|nr:xanthotoxin 5-hydroxylase CYP82C4-like [Impatiens glandulifera]
MEFFLYLQVLIIVVIITLIIHLIASSKCFKNKIKSSPPQPAGSLPLIGHLHLLGGNKLIHKTLSDMSDTNGSIFSLRLGFRKAIVISSGQIAKECFTTNDKTFSTRPKSLALKLMAYNQSVVGFAPYGPYWRAMRKFITINLLTSHKLHLLRRIRFSEVDFMMKTIYQKWDGNSVLIDVKEMFKDMSTNIITRIVAGKRYGGCNNEESRKWQKAFGEFLYLSGLFFISDAIPLLGWLDVVNGNCGRMKRAAIEADKLFDGWLKEHKEKRFDGPIRDEDNDLIHVMLSDLEDGDLASLDYDSDTVIKSTCMSMVLGGNDTTSVAMTWAVSFLLNNRHVLAKAQEEIDTHVGMHRKVEESDIDKLVYLQAIMKETFRLQPTFPLLVTREAMEDCTVAGFDIPNGTRLMVNVWKMHRDPSVWSEPLEFKPERFLVQEKNIDLRGKNFELLPFGSGRRLCPGITFSQQIMHLGLARLIQGFELDTTDGLKVDMTESPGLTVPKATPLEVLLIPRLSRELYMCEESNLKM